MMADQAGVTAGELEARLATVQLSFASQGQLQENIKNLSDNMVVLIKEQMA